MKHGNERLRLNRSTTIPLCAVLVLHIALSVFTSAKTPLWEGFDETGHYMYARFIGRERALPPRGIQMIERDESHQPPLAYLFFAVPFLFVDTSDDLRPQYTFLGRTITVDNRRVDAFPWTGTALAFRLSRFVSIIMGTFAVWLTFLAARAFLPRDDALALFAALIHALWPAFVFLNGVINNDNLVTLVGSACIFALAKLRSSSGASAMRWFAVTFVFATLAILAKSNGLTLALGTMAIAAILLFGRTPLQWRWQTTACVALGFLGASLTVVIANWASNGRHESLVNAVVEFAGRALGTAAPQQATGAISRDSTGILLSFLNGGAIAIFQSFLVAYGSATVLPPWSWYWVGLGYAVLVVLGNALATITNSTKKEEPQASRYVGVSGTQLILAAFIVFVALAPIARGVGTYFQGRFMFPALSAFSILVAIGLHHLPVCLRKLSKLTLMGGLSFMCLAGPGLIMHDNYLPPALRPPAELVSEIEVQTDIRFGDGIAIMGYSLPVKRAAPGGDAQVKVYWHALKGDLADYGVRLDLFTIDGTSLEFGIRQTPGNNNYPTNFWRAGDAFAEVHTVPIPNHPALPAVVELRIELLEPKTYHTLPVTCGTPQGRVPCVARVGHLPVALGGSSADVTTSSRPGWGGQIVLQDAEYSQTVSAGETFLIRARWTAVSNEIAPLTSFVHIVDQNGALVAQQDQPPSQYRFPVQYWRRGDTITDTIAVQIPPALAPGEYSLLLGVYDSASGERLQLRNGQAYDDGAQLHRLGTIMIVR